MERVTIKPYTEGEPYRALAAEYHTPMLVLDCKKVAQQYGALQAALPNVTLYYAIKSQPHPAIIETLKYLGAGFDIASSGEIGLLYPHWIGARNIIHTHPIKRDKDIRDALRFGCTTFVADNAWELEKFVGYRSRVGIFIRVSFPNPDAPVDLSRKFGCHPDEVEQLIQKAVSLNIHVKGLSFHAGSQSPNPKNHLYAINECHKIIARYNEQGGKLLSILNIGGGFPVTYVNSPPHLDQDIDQFCTPIRETLDNLPDYIQVIAEPGRFLSAPTMTAISQVIGKAHRGGQIWYYLDDGLYGSYSGQIYDHAIYPLTVFSDHTERETATIAGPTCDSIDVIAEDVMLPSLEIGDFIIGEQMGAYTNASATDFNLFERAKIVPINLIY